MSTAPAARRRLQRLIAAAPERIRAEKARRHFAEFVRQGWPVVPALEPLQWGWHMEAMAAHLEEVARGRIPRLVINVPPGFGKSVLLSVLWPAWIWSWWPRCQFLFGSYGEKLALRDAWRCRAVIESDWYRESFSGPAGWTLRDDQNAKGYFVNTLGGERYATGVGGTGRRAHRIGIDDPLDIDERFSKAARDAANDWIGQTLTQRFVDPQAGAVAMIMQRLHEEDPTGYVLGGSGWKHLPSGGWERLPGEHPGRWERLHLPQEIDEAELAEPCITFHHDPATGVEVPFWREPRRQAGDLLFPQRVPRAVVEAKKLPNALGPDGFASQEQQRPTPAGGKLFRVGDWRFWKPDGAAPDHAAARPRGCYPGPANPLASSGIEAITISIDGTFKRTERGSFVAMHAWAGTGARRLLLDREHDRMDYDECERRLVGDRSLGRHNPIGGFYGRVSAAWSGATITVLVEDKANGSMLVNRLTNVLDVPRVVAVSPGTDDKEKRAQLYSLPYQRAGNVELPDGAPWIAEYIGEHAAFPLGKSNDDVDAQSQALQHLEQPLTTTDYLMRTEW